MNRALAARRILIATAVLAMVAGAVGFVVALVLNTFVLDRYNAYGEVPIPGTSSLHLPAGEVTVSLHTMVISSPTGGGLPVPRIELSIKPPAGVADPEVSESIGATTTVNNDTHRRLWRMQVAADGDYQITTAGQVGGFISPRLAFGHTSSYGSLVWAFAALFGAGLLDLFFALWWSARGRRRLPPNVATAEPVASGTSGEEAIRLEQLKNLDALRGSGALTQAEFETEKRRILDGQ